MTVVGTALWSYVLLGRSADWHPWLRGAVLVAGLLAAVGLLAGAVLPGRTAEDPAGDSPQETAREASAGRTRAAARRGHRGRRRSRRSGARSGTR